MNASPEKKKTYTITNLLVPAAIPPLPAPATCILPSVNDPLAAPSRYLLHHAPTKPQPIEDSQPEPIEDDIRLLQQCPEGQLPRYRLQVDLGIPFPDLGVEHSNRRFGDILRDTQHVSALQHQNLGDGGPGNHSREIENLDPGQWPVSGVSRCGPGHLWQSEHMQGISRVKTAMQVGEKKKKKKKKTMFFGLVAGPGYTLGLVHQFDVLR